MTLRQLQYFQILARTRHYTKTAEQLYISQPSLSAAINDLEKELGTKLFVKEKRNVVLTEQGQQFLLYVDQALLLLQQGVDAITNTQTTQQVVRLGYFQSIATTLVPALVNGFYQQVESDRIQFQFTEVSSYAVLTKIHSGTLDLGFSFHQADWAQSVAVGSQQLYLAVPSNHPLAGSKEVSFLDFSAEPLIALGKNSSLRHNLDQLFMKHGLLPKHIFEVRECNAALQYVSLGFGVSVLPYVPAMESEKIVILPIPDPDRGVIRTIYSVFHKHRHLSCAAEAVKNYIVNTFAQDYIA